MTRCVRGWDVRAETDADGVGLTRREHDVLRLVSVGHTNPEIAGERFLSQRTVDMHVRNVLRKLDWSLTSRGRRPRARAERRVKAPARV